MYMYFVEKQHSDSCYQESYDALLEVHFVQERTCQGAVAVALTIPTLAAMSKLHVLTPGLYVIQCNMASKQLAYSDGLQQNQYGTKPKTRSDDCTDSIGQSDTFITAQCNVASSSCL